MVANHFFKLAVTKGIASGILRFNNAVGVKQEAVAWVERQVTNGIVGVTHAAREHHLCDTKGAVAKGRIQGVNPQTG